MKYQAKHDTLWPFSEAKVRIFKNAWFVQFARKQRITDDVLIEAVARAERGLVDADLGGGVIKQRIARRGQGRSGGYRSIILYLRNERAFFVYGFAKSDRDNLDGDETAQFKAMAKHVLMLSDEHMAESLKKGVFVEMLDGEEIQK